ncbi:hypothetical protein PPYR_04614 [Photinus pyralis]|uniref:Anoctamin n=1 Tax=Photinus pyralis TaxID=7054 RepID=A0A5N4AYU9_PHOPY|nr:anoctamin-3-like isoform X2 [Photinus pyralis]KAB0802428.1 hypothetical protein PPYR_04614 [Photinus pyralis]
MQLTEVESTFSKTYFSDGKRRIDFILVYKHSTVSAQEKEYIKTYISNLENKGLHFEMSEGIKDDTLMFVKVHGPKKLLTNYAEALGVPLACTSLYYQVESTTKYEIMKTDITNPNSITFSRALKSLKGEKPSRISTMERAIVINKLLNTTQFGPDEFECGISKLIKKKIFIAAYPLHAGNWRWTEEGHLTKLQLLAEFWARLSMWYKEQPLNLIKMYFGSEVAVYFAFCGFYNRMLIHASIVGILCVFYGIFTTHHWNYNITKELCSSDLKICPPYFTLHNWKFTYLKQYCGYAKAMCVFDNTGTVVFAFCMAFWGTVFLYQWKRYYTTLSLHWNIQNEEDVEDISKQRQEILRNPTLVTIKNNAITVIVCLAMMLIVLTAIFGTIIYRLTVTDLINASNVKILKNNTSFFTMTTGSLLSVMFMKVFNKWYGKISIWLTENENPKTQEQFDKSYIHKRFLLSFVNNYATMVYISFVKGKLYTYPGEKGSWILTHFHADICHPAGCIMGICIQLAFVMLFKSLVGNIYSAMMPACKKRLKWGISQSTNEDLPRWEQDFELREVERYFLVGEYMEIVMQYGFVTFFAAAFPLAPLCALINNILELRTDAHKYVRICRRPVPICTGSMNVWINLLKAMSSMSIISNAFIIAFTSNIVKRELYRAKHDYMLKGFINSTLSVFDPKDLKGNFTHSDLEMCYYRGERNSPGTPDQYKLSGQFWLELSVRFIVAIFFEHIMLMFTGILSSMMPNVTPLVKMELKHQNIELKQKQMKADKNVPRGTNVFKE